MLSACRAPPFQMTRKHPCLYLQHSATHVSERMMNSCLILTTKTDRDFGYKDIKRPAFERWRCSSGFLPVGTFHLYRIYFTTCVVVHSRLGLAPYSPGLESSCAPARCFAQKVFGSILLKSLRRQKAMVMVQCPWSHHARRPVQFGLVCCTIVAATPGSATCLPDAIPASSSPGVKSTGAMPTAI